MGGKSGNSNGLSRRFGARYVAQPKRPQRVEVVVRHEPPKRPKRRWKRKLIPALIAAGLSVAAVEALRHSGKKYAEQRQ